MHNKIPNSSRMRQRRIRLRWRLVLSAVLAVCCLVPMVRMVSYATEEADIAARMVEDVSKLLDQLLGHGKARIFITVEGERNTINTNTEITTPASTIEEVEGVVLPGYTVSKYLEKTYRLTQKNQDNQPVQKEQEQSSRTLGFIISRIHVSLVLDRRIPDVQANAVRLVVSDLLRLDLGRGDTLSVIRADMLPLWKSAFLTPEGYRTIFSIGILIAIVVFVFILVYSIASRLMLAAAEYARMRRAQTAEEMPPASQAQIAGGGAVGVVGAGAAGHEGVPEMFDMEGPRTAVPLPEPAARFDFLEKLPVKEVHQMLELEPIEDIALITAYISDKNPNIASKLLMLFTIEKRGKITKAMISIKEADPERLGEIDDRLRTRADMLLKGEEKLGKLLSIMDPGDRSNILGDLSATDPEGSVRVEQALVTFEDICQLPLEDLRPVVNSVHYQKWGIALRGTAKEHIKRILEIFPVELRELVNDIIASPQKKDTITEAKFEIVNSAMGLVAGGKIAFKQQESQDRGGDVV